MGAAQSAKLKPDVSKVTQDKSKRGLCFGTAAMKGWRKFMEDTSIAIMNLNNNPDLDLFAIFDGHGGPQVAILVAQQFPKQLVKNLNFLSGNYNEALHQTFLKMDEIIRSDYGIRKLEQIIQQESQRKNCKNLFGQSVAGCTALVCLITSDKVYVANAGDSKGIAFVNKEIIDINTEHKPTLYQEETRIRNSGGFIQYGRIMGEINISRCIGDLHYKKNEYLQRHQQMIICDPQIRQIQRSNVEYILLGSDGIWDNKTTQTMHKWLMSLSPEMKLSKKISLLFDSQVAPNHQDELGKDNMTAILINVIH